MNTPANKPAGASSALPAPSTALPPSSNVAAVRLRGVEKSFGKADARIQVLKQASFECHYGELQLLVGPSGCGKTTLLSILTGTLHAEAGEIEVLGERLDRMRPGAVTRFRARHLGFIFQQFNLIPTLTATENVSLPLLIQGMGTRRAEQRARETLVAVGLADKLRAYPAKLSGGQQQRVAIARALVHQPRLIVCDEPTSALDRENGQSVMHLLRQAAVDPQRAVIVVTHDNRVYKHGDRMAEMEDGRVLRIREKPPGGFTEAS